MFTSGLMRTAKVYVLAADRLVDGFVFRVEWFINSTTTNRHFVTVETLYRVIM